MACHKTVKEACQTERLTAGFGTSKSQSGCMQVAPLDSASQTADNQSEKDSVTHGEKCDVASPNSENDDQSDTQSNDNQSGSECSMLQPLN